MIDSDHSSVHMIFHNFYHCAAESELSYICNSCKINISPLEMKKCDNIKRSLIYRVEENSWIVMFRRLEEDDITKILIIPIDESNFSSDDRVL